MTDLATTVASALDTPTADNPTTDKDGVSLFGGNAPSTSVSTDHYEAPTEQARESGQDPQQPAAMVPSGRLREESDKRRELEAQLAERDAQLSALSTKFDTLAQYVQQQQSDADAAAAVDADDMPELDDEDVARLMIEDPGAYHRYAMDAGKRQAENVGRLIAAEVAKQIGGVSQTTADMKLAMSDQMAIQAGIPREKIQIATTAANNAGLKDHFMADPNPIMAAVNWYDQQQVSNLFGTNPQQVLQRAAEHLAKDPNYRAYLQSQPLAQQTGQQPVPASTPANVAFNAPQQPVQQALPPAMTGNGFGQAPLQKNAGNTFGALLDAIGTHEQAVLTT